MSTRQITMIEVRALGGSGEYLRNCYLLEADGHCFLLDCGVKRILAPEKEVYPLLTPSLAGRIEAVFLSHAHEDHTAALPYLVALGYQGPVYGSAPTISFARGFMQKWMSYVTGHDCRVPFDASCIDRVNLLPLSLGTQRVSGVPLVCGRSGHMLGSMWYQFLFASGSVLYTGDTTKDGYLLACDPYPQSDVLVVDSAYADTVLSQEAQYASLSAQCKEVVSKGGSVLLPVPANGRGSDIFLFLARQALPLVVEKSIVEKTSALACCGSWTKFPVEIPSCIVADEQNRAELPLAGKVILAPDGMLTSPIGLSYLSRLGNDASSKVILTGYVSEGTMGWQLLHGTCSYALQASSVTIKVHPDQEEVMRIVGEVRPAKVMLFHAPLSQSTSLIASLRAKKLEVACGLTEPLVFGR